MSTLTERGEKATGWQGGLDRAYLNLLLTRLKKFNVEVDLALLFSQEE